jgi:hypothetical protein
MKDIIKKSKRRKLRLMCSEKNLMQFSESLRTSATEIDDINKAVVDEVERFIPGVGTADWHKLVYIDGFIAGLSAEDAISVLEDFNVGLESGERYGRLDDDGTVGRSADAKQSDGSESDG